MRAHINGGGSRPFSSFRRRHRRAHHRLRARPSGSPVRVFEQSSEFRGSMPPPGSVQHFPRPEKIGLRCALANAVTLPPGDARRRSPRIDAHIPSAMHLLKQFDNPTVAASPADIHGAFLKAYQEAISLHWKLRRRSMRSEDHGDHVSVTLNNGETDEGRALIACDGMSSKSGEYRRRSRDREVVGAHRLPRRSQARDVPEDLLAPRRRPVGRSAHPFRLFIPCAAVSSTTWSPSPLRSLRGRLERRRQ